MGLATGPAFLDIVPDDGADFLSVSRRNIKR